MIVYVTGGARSGKSKIAEEKVVSLAAELGDNESVAYIATAIAFDDGMKDRINKHQKSRPASWKTIEKYKNFESLSENQVFLSANAIIFDCITVMITNLMLEYADDFDKMKMEEVNAMEASIKSEVEMLIDTVLAYDKHLVIVSNEVGMGLVPAYKMGNFFRDIQGRINQYLAACADEVYFAVSGLPMKLK